MLRNVVSKSSRSVACMIALGFLPAIRASALDRPVTSPAIEIGSPDLLRNDETTTIAPLTPARGLIFTGTTSACSPDTTISLDKADPSNCASSIEGEGVSTPTNGSDDRDDFYVRNFVPAGASRTDADSGLLTDLTRPLIYYQIENACDNNSVLMVKNRTQNSVDIFLGNAVACPVGACCDASGTCGDGALEFECVGAGGTYQGDASTCVTNPCPSQTGACCTATGCLPGQTQPACTAAGGTYQGNGSTCVANPCPPATGACCTTTACLDAQTQATCTAAGGNFQGVGTTCAANPCPASTGACCTSTTCLNAQTSAACAAASGVYQGNNTTCAANPCVGACCRSGVGCTPTQTQTACQANGGVYQGNNTSCGPTSCAAVGACCSATQPCADGQTQSGCLANGGVYQGNTTTCAGTPCSGACCTPGQQCLDAQTATSCTAASGTYQGDTTQCATSPCAGACCVPGAGCFDGETASGCQARGGSFQGNLTTCLANPCPGACCSPAGTCSNGVLQTTCVSGGGIFQGQTTDCATNPCLGACCSPNFGCNQLTATACDQQAGTSVWLGVATVCGVDPCPVTGACCGVFGCTSDYGSTCVGTYMGDGVPCTPNPCSPTGACCDDINSTCTDGTENSCTAAGGRFVSGDVCGPNTCDLGACCSTQFPCVENVSPEECDDLPGSAVFAGDNTTCATGCPPTGACCGIFGCTIQYQAGCIGTYVGDGTVCTPTTCAGAVIGACCNDVLDTCANLSMTDCTAQSGRFVSGMCGGNTCDLGACCSPQFPCVDGIDPLACDRLAGVRVHLGDNTQCGIDPCPPTGACCTGFGLCQLNYATSCNGTYLGDGTTCGAGVCP